jgi:hypothetical protein
MQEEIVTLATVANGAAVELFQHELNRVLANIADINTSPKKKRQVTLKVIIQPSDDRGIGYTSVEVNSSLAPVKPVEATMYFGKKDGQLVAVQSNPAQPGIFDEEKSKITPLTAVAARKDA